MTIRLNIVVTWQPCLSLTVEISEVKFTEKQCVRGISYYPIRWLEVYVIQCVWCFVRFI